MLSGDRGPMSSSVRCGPYSVQVPILRGLQTKYCLGPGVLAANMAFLQACARARPRRGCSPGAHPGYGPGLWKAAKRMGSFPIAIYNNDNPFGPDADMPIWRHFRMLIPVVDTCFVYRRSNIAQYESAGAKSVKLLRSYFQREVHRPVILSESDRSDSRPRSCSFGHCEPDSRLELLDRLIDSGIGVRLLEPTGTGTPADIAGRHVYPLNSARR